MHNILHGSDEQPEYKAAHDVGLEGALVEFTEALLIWPPTEPQRHHAHIIHAHATVAAYFDVVYYVVLLRFHCFNI